MKGDEGDSREDINLLGGKKMKKNVREMTIKNMGQTGPAEIQVKLDEKQIEFIGFMPNQGHFDPQSITTISFVVEKTRWGKDPRPQVLRKGQLIEDLEIEIRIFNNEPVERNKNFLEGKVKYTPQEGDIIRTGCYSGPCGEKFSEKVQLVSSGWQITLVK